MEHRRGGRRTRRLLPRPRFTPRQVRATSSHLADFQRELIRLGVELDWPAGFRETGRSHFSHHKQEIKDADTYYFGEAWRR